MFLKISQNSQENTCVRISFLIRLHVESSTFIKQGNPAQVFTFKFCEVFKNSSFIEHLWWLLLERAKNCDPLWTRYETMNPKSQPCGLFWGYSQMTRGQKGSTSWNLSHISCNDETWHSYTLPEENPKNI